MGHYIDSPHALFAMAFLIDKLLIVGGFNRTNKNIYTNKVLVLDSGQWKDYTEMPTARGAVTAVSHQSMMIVMGGSGDDDNTFSTTELLDGTTGQWFKCDDLPQPLQSSQSVIAGDMLYVLGGYNADNDPSTAVYAAPLNNLSSHQLKWQRLIDTPRGGLAAISLNNKYVLAVGGKKEIDQNYILTNEVFTLNSTATTWTLTTTIPMEVMGSAVVCDNTSRLIVIGGIIIMEGEMNIINKVYIGSFQQ